MTGHTGFKGSWLSIWLHLLGAKVIGIAKDPITEKDNFVVLATMKSFEEQLPNDRFLRTHKSYIVNLDKIERYNSKTIEIDKEKLPLSRHKKANLVEALSALQEES
ncbi:MAG: hypothetical protein CME35_13330 [Gramella sp.]|nr:hypothetical protein [Christiangramia sp.]